MQDETGRVLMRYVYAIRKTIQVGRTEYVFIPQRNVSGCWVKPEHVEILLSDKGRACCGGRNQFFIASEENAKEWLGLSPRYPKEV